MRFCFRWNCYCSHDTNHHKKAGKEKKKNLYMAIVKLDTPVLLITDHVWDGTVNMAHLYQYHKKKVRYIGYIGAGGTATAPMIPTIIKKQIIIFFKLFFIIISPLYCATMKESHPIRWKDNRDAENAQPHFCCSDIPSDRMGFFHCSTI